MIVLETVDLMNFVLDRVFNKIEMNRLHKNPEPDEWRELEFYFFLNDLLKYLHRVRLIFLVYQLGHLAASYLRFAQFYPFRRFLFLFVLEP